jgi:hypothetical protein
MLRVPPNSDDGACFRSSEAMREKIGHVPASRRRVLCTRSFPVPTTSLPTVRVVNLRPQVKGSLRAFVDLELTRIGLVLRDCTWHRQANGREWIGLPSKPYQGADGVTRWKPMVEFASNPSETRRRFQEAALAAIHVVAAIDEDAAR